MSSHAPKRVLLTGANGYLAQHILAQLLEAGHSVRAVVRSEDKADLLRRSFAKYYEPGALDFGVVPDITRPGAFDEVLRHQQDGYPPFDVVVHTASPFNYRRATAAGDSNAVNFLDPAIKGMREILGGIGRVGTGVRRVVFTSSMAAVITWTDPKVTDPPRIYSGDDWNPVSLEEGHTTDNLNTAYQASKTWAEKAAWDIAEGGNNDNGSSTKPLFGLVTICPPMLYGPVFDPTQFNTPADLNQSTWNIYNQLLHPQLKSTDPIPPTGLHLYADVRDAARAHVLAVHMPRDAPRADRRLVVCAGEMSYQRMANLLREAVPERRDVIPRGSPGEWRVDAGSYRGGSEVAERVLGLTFRSAEETMGDLGTQFVEIEKRGAGGGTL